MCKMNIVLCVGADVFPLTPAPAPADGHGHNDRLPARLEDLPDLWTPPGNDHPHRDEDQEEDTH